MTCSNRVNTWASLSAVALILLFSPVHAQEDPHRYCEEMYPVESYEPDERAQYIQECLAVTVEESDTYYDGTVEDYVNSLPEDDNREEPVEEESQIDY